MARDFVPGMAIDGKLVYWVYQESDASIAAGKERKARRGWYQIIIQE